MLCFSHGLQIPPALVNVTKYHSNFSVTRVQNFVYTIFPKGRHVNISGIKNFENIKEALITFNGQFDTNITRDNIIIDNLTASGQLTKQNIHLSKLLHCAGRDNVIISVRPYYFPSALIRPKDRTGRDNLTTGLLFANGKFIIIGGKSLTTIENTYTKLCALTNNL